MITTTVNESLQLTIHRCQGKVGVDEIQGIIDEFYRRGPTRNVFWDLSGADLSKVTIGDIEQLARAVNKMTHGRSNGKTAILSPHDISFGLSREYQAFAETDQPVAETRVFRSEEEALGWLKE